ncbi:hypothetical protein CFC21_077241 [Triticum aestivum]|uniref:Zinc finger PHD-type domain-containing protein n=2 Tax=Triticum aestivum TaxID=4565 RepID=A0A9R1KZE8_WHEAT|nr:hypothetical protein CFC21_077241 [Triticum aestivum]
MMMMSDDDDDSDPQFNVVADYFFVDAEKNPICLSALPIRFEQGTDEATQCKQNIVLRGVADSGITVYTHVVAWKLGLEGKQPVIAVLSVEGSWMNLAKPRNSYEEEFRTIFITVRMLHFLRRKPEEPEKNLWSHLRKVFDKFDLRPSKDDFRNHRSLLKLFAEKDLNLAKSQVLRAFIEDGSKKQTSEVESDNIEMKQSFIASDEEIEDMVSDGSSESDGNSESDEEEDDLFDFTCAICDNGGDLLGCDGPCMRSFHAKIGTGEDSYCDTLGFTEAEVEAMKTFLCKNCEYKQHQCFICGVLEPSDGPTAKVFLCNNATCGYFYHPKCVARKLHPNNKIEALEKENKIIGGSSFTCPIHWCFHCKGLEDRSQEQLQFAVCRRCPKSYHRKCLPRDHEIDSDIETPVRNHIKFPGIPKIVKPADYLKRKNKVLINKRKRDFDESFLEQSSNKAAKVPVKVRVQEDEHARKFAVKSSSEQFVDKPEKKKPKVKDTSASSSRPANEQEKYLATSPSSTMGNLPQSSFPRVDSETEKRVIALVEKEGSSLTLKDISSRCLVPSTHVYAGRQTDKIVATGKLERSVQAVGAALKALGNGGNVNEAKAVCEPQVLKQLTKWHTRLRVYISPFIYGSRYSSFGRHFTKVDKLVEIVDKLHWYVEPGDTIVDFCCGANDFSRLMKEKLDEVDKKCHFKNYDLIQPQNSFCFERRDWMTVQPDELPGGRQLIMGLNPPFGVKAALANKFIDKALSFKPKLVILIVPKETKRLDQKKTPYDLVWEDSNCLAGKSFYLPGSLDVNDKIVQGWNASAPPLYLWSRSDWTKKHKEVAKAHNHTSVGKISRRVEQGNLSDDGPAKKEAESSDVHNSRPGKEKENIRNTSCHPREVNLSNNLPARRKAEPKSKQNARSGKAKETREKATCDFREDSPSGKAEEKRHKAACSVREVSPSDDHLVKKQDRPGEEKAARKANFTVKKQARPREDEEANLSGNRPLKKQAEATSQQISRPGKQNSRDESKSSDDRRRKRIPDEADSLPPEKQVEVAYEETRAIPSKRGMHQGQSNGTNARVKESKGSSDMSMSSSLENSTARHRSRSNSPFIPNEQPSGYTTAHRDSNMKYHVKEPRVSTFNSATTYQASYLANSDGRKDAIGERNDPTFYMGADDRSSAYNSSIEEMTKRYAPGRAGDVCSPQGQGNGGSFSRRQDDHLQTSLYSLGSSGARYDQIGSSGARYDQIVSSGARYDPRSLTSPSYGLLSTTPRSSVIDKYSPGFSGSSGSGPSVMDSYAPGYLGANAPGRSLVMDRYAPPLDETNYAMRGVHDVPGYGRDMPPQYPYRGPDPSGRGPPHI